MRHTTQIYLTAGRTWSIRFSTAQKVAEIPIAQPTNFILAINLKTAKALGLQIPATLLAQAKKVIEW